MVENHKDKISQQQEEAEAIKKRKNRKMNHDSEKEDQVHRYMHGGAENGINQNTPEEVQEEESAIETQEYWHVAGDKQE
eukprot:14603808-Heterocapsa_arctica.AAC.1